MKLKSGITTKDMIDELRANRDELSDLSKSLNRREPVGREALARIRQIIDNLALCVSDTIDLADLAKEASKGKIEIKKDKVSILKC